MKLIVTIYQIFLVLLWKEQLPESQMGEWNRHILDQTLCMTSIILVLLYISLTLWLEIEPFLHFYKKKNLFEMNCAIVDQVRQRKPEDYCRTLKQIQS